MKNKKDKKLIVMAIFIAILIVVGLLTLFLLNKQDKKSTLTILDKQWIENNKSKIVDVAILNNVPIYGNEGNGIFFNFIKALEKNTGLDFNEVPYVLGSTPSLGDYEFKVLGSNVEPSKQELSVYKDEYVLIGKNDIQTTNLKDLNGYVVGTLSDDVNLVSYYLNDGNALSYKAYDSISALFDGLNKDESTLIAIPYNLYLNQVLANANYHVVYHLSEISKQYVLELSKDNSKLNAIITKYYQKWQQDNLIKNANALLFNQYIQSLNIDDKTKNAFQSKRYTYGVVNNQPYEMLVNNQLVGINAQYINKFKQITGLEFNFVSYANVDDLNKAMADGKIDICFDYYNNNNSNYVKTTSIYDGEYVLLAYKKNNIIINSLKSIGKQNSVYVVKNTVLADNIKSIKDINLKEFPSSGNLLDNINSNSLVLIDKNTYKYYQTTKLKNFVVAYQDKLDHNYNFIIKNIAENKTFTDIFNRFIASRNFKQLEYNAFMQLFENPVRQSFFQSIYNYLLIIIVVVFLFLKFSVSMFNRKKTKKKLKKEDKLKYRDMLTALKNRNYLNDHLEEWDENKVYPQAIIVVDLNNIKYVNDNFGHEEGDNVIKKAAAILINTQLENSDIMRTDGNEFLIYLVGYSQQQIVSYTRKVNKEMKGLPHDFGAAIGFSMIEDDIKTLDDAINEASLDMRNNKEEQKA